MLPILPVVIPLHPVHILSPLKMLPVVSLLLPTRPSLLNQLRRLHQLWPSLIQPAPLLQELLPLLPVQQD